MLGDYAATGNWLYGKKSGGGPHSEELSAGKQTFLVAKSFLLTTKLGDSGIFICPAAAAWFMAQIPGRSSTSLRVFRGFK